MGFDIGLFMVVSSVLKKVNNPHICKT